MSKEKSGKGKIKRPTKVRVFGRMYSVTYLTELQGLSKLGKAHYNEGVINIQEGQKPLEEVDTILHEFLHIINDAAELELSERQIAVTARGIIGILQDNPKFAKYIIYPRK